MKLPSAGGYPAAIEDQLVEVQFDPDRLVAWVRSGATLVQAGAAAGIEIATGCTRGMCGTDPVLVREGADRLTPPEDDERGTLERMGLCTEYRLACSARVVRGPIRVETGTF